MTVAADAGDIAGASTGVDGGMPLAALPVAALVIAGDRVVDANPGALALLGATSGDGVIGRLLSEVLVQGDALSAAPGGAILPDDAGTRWRHGMLRPVVGGARSVLVSIGDGPADGLPGSAAARRAMVLIPRESERDGMFDAGMRDESRGRIADVFANLAHEMRTPLNAVIGFGEIMQAEHFGPLAGRYKQYAQDIVGAGYHLLALVNGALDLGRASAGPASLEERPVELRAVLVSARAMLAPAAAAKSIVLDIDDLAGLPLVYADETRMRQLFVNLIGNAIKYSPRGRPIVVRHHLAEDGEISVEVVDGGVGMTRDEVAIAMLPFGRTESAMRTGEAGTGLGLPISKAIVEAHGGRMIVDSAPRRGTTVTVVLPGNRLVAAPGHGGLLSLL